MANPEHLAILRLGVEQWNLWREQHPVFRPDLSRASLLGADLRKANLGRANLNGAYLVKANLLGADLSFANLVGASLSAADLSFANLSEADLSGADIWRTVFANVDLRSVKGLVAIRYRGPSIVQLHTVQLPQDGSALHFLRGTGIPDEWIDLYCATMMRPIQYHSIFISYSSKDQSFAERLYADLQANGVRCWFAPEDMKTET